MQLSDHKPFDIRAYKKDMRARYKQVRADLDEGTRAEKDARILRRLKSLPEYARCKTLLCYVSMGTETGTHKLIEAALTDGKIVAVPRCRDGERRMDFYRIQSLGELVPGTFGVLEPVPNEDAIVRDFSAALCVVPGLAFDCEGYRIGYGGGYYDRFLCEEFTGKTVGICYSACVAASLRHGRYDMPCEILVTDLFYKRSNAQSCVQNAQSPANGALSGLNSCTDGY